jgi:L-seryl-tRNA(Ser) seleniumtransferase
VLHYLKDEAAREIPIWQMLSFTLEELKVRAEQWCHEIGQGKVIQSESTVGGGSLPEECISTYVLALQVKSPDRLLRRLREGSPPIIARTENDKVLLDPRTVLDDNLLLRALRKAVDDDR